MLAGIRFAVMVPGSRPWALSSQVEAHRHHNPRLSQLCQRFRELSSVILPPVHETSSAVHETSDTDNRCRCAAMSELARSQGAAKTTSSD
jgi:hypothetical protein